MINFVDIGDGLIVELSEVKFPYLNRLSELVLKCIDSFAMSDLIKPKLNVFFSKDYDTTRIALEYDQKINSSVWIYDREENNAIAKDRINKAIYKLLTVQKEEIV